MKNTLRSPLTFLALCIVLVVIVIQPRNLQASSSEESTSVQLPESPSLQWLSGTKPICPGNHTPCIGCLVVYAYDGPGNCPPGESQYCEYRFTRWDHGSNLYHWSPAGVTCPDGLGCGPS